MLGKSNQISDATVITFASGANNSRFQLSNAGGAGYNETIGSLSDAAGTFTGARIVESAADSLSNSAGTLTINTAGQNYTFGGYVRNAQGGATNSALSVVKDAAGAQTFSGWGTTVSYSGSTSGSFSVETASAILDLGGTSQTVGSASAIGTVTNGALNVATQLSIGDPLTANAIGRATFNNLNLGADSIFEWNFNSTPEVTGVISDAATGTYDRIRRMADRSRVAPSPPCGMVKFLRAFWVLFSGLECCGRKPVAFFDLKP